MFFGLSAMWILMILIETGVQLMTGLNFGFIYDKAHSMLLSCVVAAEPKVVSFFRCRLCCRVTGDTPTYFSMATHLLLSIHDSLRFVFLCSDYLPASSWPVYHVGRHVQTKIACDDWWLNFQTDTITKNSEVVVCFWDLEETKANGN